MGCGGDSDATGGGGSGSQDDTNIEADAAAESDAESPLDGAIGEPLVDPCADKGALRIELLTAARACMVDNQCTKSYFGPAPCSCNIYLNAEAGLDDLFAVDQETMAECGDAATNCMAAECLVTEGSCDAGLCVTTVP